MMPLVPPNVVSRFTEPLLHPAAIFLADLFTGGPAAREAVLPVAHLAWRLLQLLLSI
jgi:hypothetical protein